MSEVHRYQVVTMLSDAGNKIAYDPHGPEVVMASAFDEANRLFLDAAERCVASERREKELQQRLTAADERADELLVMLRMAWIDTEVSAYNCRRIDAALKLAEVAKCERCGCSTVETCDDRGCGYLGAGNGAPE